MHNCEEHTAENVEHKILHCNAFDRKRRTIHEGKIPELKGHMIANKEVWDRGTSAIGWIMSKKHAFRRARPRRNRAAEEEEGLTVLDSHGGK